MRRALLVDLDGTLVDTEEANYVAYATALREVGVDIGREAFREAAFGRNWRQFLPDMLAYRPVDPAEVAARKTMLYPGMLHLTIVNKALVTLIEGVRPGWRTALVTTASAPNADAILRHHGLADLFDLVVTGNDVQRHKPDPEAYLHAAERLDVSAAACVIVEDSEIGMAAAAAFGAPCLRVVPPSL